MGLGSLYRMNMLSYPTALRHSSLNVHVGGRNGMTKDGDDPNKPVTPAVRLREQASRARRLARGPINEADRRILIEVANQLEAEAATLETACQLMTDC
jgi:hypothetical protein